ncbi:hypothetical protein ACFL20_02155 [Spirochaetota bacterium]
MGSLKDMIKFLEKTNDSLGKVEKNLDEIQEYFNNNFSNLNIIRNEEIEFLQDEFFNDYNKFPGEIQKLYKGEIKNQEDLFDKNYTSLLGKKNQIDSELNSQDKKRKNLYKHVKSKNKMLDKGEERLKKRVLELEKEIDQYNLKIDELNTGMGIITNLFRMKKIQRRKDELLEQRDDNVERIEETRTKWEEEFNKFEEKNEAGKKGWEEELVEYSITVEKLNSLKENRDDIIKKASFVSALQKIKGDEKYLTAKIKTGLVAKCPRCKSHNKSNRFFCRFCGERFSKDRPDIMGSLVESGELNIVYNDLLEGIKESVSFLALIRGIGKGVTEFTKSVESVKDSQDKYPSLSELKIDVPEFSLNFSKTIDELESRIDVKFYNLHPGEFSQSFKEYTVKLFSDENIERYFNSMGEELDRTTKEQW